MCNHYRNHTEAISTWREYIGWSLPADEFSEIKIDVWPKRQGVVILDREGERVAEAMQWGVPLTVAGKRPGTTVTRHVTNVRNLASPFWRGMLANPSHRCLVPFTAFAEPKPDAGREEIWFGVREAPVAAFAGVWRPSEAGDVFAFLTCEPNPLIAPIHPKAMPVILHPEEYDHWLRGDPAAELSKPFPSQLMAICGSTDD